MMDIYINKPAKTIAEYVDLHIIITDTLNKIVSYKEAYRQAKKHLICLNKTAETLWYIHQAFRIKEKWYYMFCPSIECRTILPLSL